MKIRAKLKKLLVYIVWIFVFLASCMSATVVFAKEIENEGETPAQNEEENPLCLHDGASHRENVVEASCDTENEYKGKGYTGDLICDLCGDTIEKGEDTPALNHEFPSEALVKDRDDDYFHYYVNKCTRCGLESYVTENYKGTITTKKEAHDFQITEHKEPTETEEGYTENTCSICGHVYLEIIPPVGQYTDRFRSEGKKKDLLFVLGYTWWTETEVLANYSKSQISSMAEENILTYSFRDSINSVGYARVKGIYFEDLIQFISQQTGRFEMDEVEGFRFSASDNYKAGTYFSAGLIFDPNRYFYPNLSLYADGMGGFTDLDAAEEGAEQVPAMLAVYEGRIRAEQGKGYVENLAASMGVLTDGKAYRLMFGQKGLEDQTAGNSIAEIQGITIILNAMPNIGLRDSDGNEISKNELSLVIDDENIVRVEITGVGEKATERFLQNVKWSTTDSTVVSVDQNGKLTAKGEGTATITATSKVGEKTITKTITVTVGNSKSDAKGEEPGEGEGEGSGTEPGEGEGSGEGTDEGTGEGSGIEPGEGEGSGQSKENGKTEESGQENGNVKEQGESDVKEREKDTLITIEEPEVAVKDIEVYKKLKEVEKPAYAENTKNSISIMKISASNGGKGGGQSETNDMIEISNDYMWLFSTLFAVICLGAGGVWMWIKYKKEF